MRAVIIDDEKANVENLEILIKKYCHDVNVVAVAYTKDEGVEKISYHRPDILFLDIQLGKETGFDLLSALQYRSFEVIFITAFDHYGIQAVKFSAIDYLLKPIDINELKGAVDKVKHKIDRQSNQSVDFLLNYLSKKEKASIKIALPQQKEIRYVAVDEIVRCQADNTYTIFFLENGEQILVSKNLKEYAELLEDHKFIRTHQSHLINRNFVKSWLREDGGTLLMSTGDRIPISKINREKVRHELAFS